MYVYIHTGIGRYICRYIHTFTQVWGGCTCRYIYIYTFTKIWGGIYVDVYIHSRRYGGIHIEMYTYIHIEMGYGGIHMDGYGRMQITNMGEYTLRCGGLGISLSLSLISLYTQTHKHTHTHTQRSIRGWVAGHCDLYIDTYVYIHIDIYTYRYGAYGCIYTSICIYTYVSM